MPFPSMEFFSIIIIIIIIILLLFSIYVSTTQCVVNKDEYNSLRFKSHATNFFYHFIRLR